MLEWIDTYEYWEEDTAEEHVGCIVEIFNECYCKPISNREAVELWENRFYVLGEYHKNSDYFKEATELLVERLKVGLNV